MVDDGQHDAVEDSVNPSVGGGESREAVGGEDELQHHDDRGEASETDEKLATGGAKPACSGYQYDEE